jgi:uncharacterized protein
MLTKETILNTLRLNKPYFEKELGVVRIGLFGSYAKDLQQSDSDVDILVELKEPDYKSLFSILILLEQQLNSKIDLIRMGPHLREKFMNTVEKEIIYA